jgi:hypothetical protein
MQQSSLPRWAPALGSRAASASDLSTSHSKESTAPSWWNSRWCWVLTLGRMRWYRPHGVKFHGWHGAIHQVEKARIGQLSLSLRMRKLHEDVFWPTREVVYASSHVPCSLVFNKSSGWRQSVETIPAVNPAMVSTKDDDRPSLIVMKIVCDSSESFGSALTDFWESQSSKQRAWE